MPSISVPNSFFISERNTIYNDWRAAFWRELLSNAVDAGSSRIMIQTKSPCVREVVRRSIFPLFHRWAG